MRSTLAERILIPSAPDVPMLDAADLPGEEDWAVLESLRHEREFADDSDVDCSIALLPAGDGFN
jgi:hypothetical protein